MLFFFKTGYIRSNGDYYFIEPAADYYPLSGDEHPHLIYKRQSDYEQNCYVTSDVAKIIAKRASTKEAEKKENSFKIQQLHIETLVVLDSSITEYHQSIDLENYILTVFNMVRNSCNAVVIVKQLFIALLSRLPMCMFKICKKAEIL